MFLVTVCSEDPDALLCDFAETYHVLDWRALPPRTAAALAAGLREDSRTMMRLRGAAVSTDTLLLAMVADRTAWIAWSRSEDGRKGKNRPKSVLEALAGGNDKKDGELLGFRDASSFEVARRELLGSG